MNRVPGRLGVWGLVIADGDGRNLAIDYPRADFDADIEERALDDRQLAATGAAVSTGSRSQPGILPPRVLLTLRSARLDGRHGRFGATASGQLILAGLTVGLHSSLLALGSVSARTQG